MSTDQQTKSYPGWPDRAYPEVFTTIPANQPKEKKPGQFTDEQLKQFFEDGYVQVDDFFATEEMDPVRDVTAEMVEELAQKLYKAGKITKLYQEYGLFERLTMMEKEFPGSNIIMSRRSRLPVAYRSLFAHERILNVMEQLLGTRDVQGCPVWVLRSKLPRNDASTVPWHQDSAYADKRSYGVMQVTAWIPLLDSNERNGCLEMVRGGHRKGLMANHTGCWRDTWYLMLGEEEMEKKLDVDIKRDSIICPVPYGGVLFFSNVLPHRSLDNTSNEIRWSLDMRWQRMQDAMGFHGLKQGVQLSSSTDPDLQIDWEPFNDANRHKAADEDAGRVYDEFSTINQGPWIRNWEMTNTNRHTKALEKQEAAAKAAAAAVAAKS